VLRERRLLWDGCLNVRDLGGHPTEDGGETRFERVVRSDSVGNLSDEGWRAAVDYGVRTVVDLRFDLEREDDPPRELAVDVVHVSLFGEPDEEWWDDLDARAGAAGSVVASTRLVYGELLAQRGVELAAAITAVADAKPGAVLVHCVGGKDRTGLVVALLLRLAGASIDDIARDYALSGEYLEPRHARWIAGAADEAERERMRRIAATPAEAMHAVLQDLEARHGGVAGYLREGGATDDVLARARARLRE
jgi:protein-tyrosine phosphatase